LKEEGKGSGKRKFEHRQLAGFLGCNINIQKKKRELLERKPSFSSKGLTCVLGGVARVL